jgi:putative flavoprotein involved in K+ transport
VIETIVVGAGHAGLAVSNLLTERGVQHTILERDSTASRWKNERWDSFTIQAPNWCNWLPNYRYTGPDPDAFMDRAEITQYIENYAKQFDAPVETGVDVTRVTAKGATLKLETNTGEVATNCLVVATGPYQAPNLPPWSAQLPASVTQLHSRDYKSPQTLPAGNVLIIGSGQSGQQIAEDLVAAGRTVVVSTGRHGRVPRQYRGRDYYFWRELGGGFEKTAEDLGLGEGAATLSGVGGGRDLDLRQIAATGATLAGTAVGYESGKVRFANDLHEILQQGDKYYSAFTEWVEDRLDRFGGLFDDATPRQVFPDPPAGPTELSLDGWGITIVIWATGFVPEYRKWIDIDVFNDAGYPIHRRGTTEQPGLYFIGLPRQYRFRSPFIRGAEEDARYLVRHMGETGILSA